MIRLFGTLSRLYFQPGDHNRLACDIIIFSSGSSEVHGHEIAPSRLSNFVRVRREGGGREGVYILNYPSALSEELLDEAEKEEALVGSWERVAN
uniref:Uncharacterized protein n=1 Tax=Triparma pacifica TaxID=91992 RepID=A0A7S2VWE5_9STRA